MSDLISREELYEKVAEWEAQALHMVEVHMHDEDKTEWRKWSIILTERSAFKFDVADMPSAERTGKWIKQHGYYDGDVYYECSECGEEFCFLDGCTPEDNLHFYCPNCGARMVSEDDT